MIDKIETPEMRHWASVKACKNILDKLVKDGEIYHYILVPDNSPLDKQGVDIRILIKRDNQSIFEIPIQVKSSVYFLKKHSDRQNQWIDAVCNAENLDLIEQFLDIIDKHQELNLIHFKKKKGVSKYPGVSFNKASKKWRADIWLGDKKQGGKQLCLGHFPTERMAFKAYIDFKNNCGMEQNKKAPPV